MDEQESENKKPNYIITNTDRDTWLAKQERRNKRRERHKKIRDKHLNEEQ